MLTFFRKAFEFVRSPTHSRTTAVIVLFLILAAVPLTVIISQKQQQLRQRAADFCSEVTEQCAPGVTLNSVCDGSVTRCRLGNDIVECK